MSEKTIYEFGAFRFHAERRQLRRADHKSLRILKKKEESEPRLGRPLGHLLLAFLKAVFEGAGHEVVLSEEDLIKAVWPDPNPDAAIAVSTLNRTLRDLKKILKNNDPRERDYIRRTDGGYAFAFPVKRLSALEVARVDAAPEKDERTKKAEEEFEWGRRLLDTFTTEDGLQNAIEQFRKAYGALPDFAAAHAHETFAHLWLSIFSWRSPRATLPAALQASARAVRCDDKLGVAHTARALTLLLSEPFKTDRWGEAEELFQQAARLDEKYEQKFETVYQMDALRLIAKRRLAEGDRAIARSLEINRVSFISNVLKALALFVSRDYQTCDNFIQQVISREYDIDAAYYIRVLVCIYKGEPDRALEEIERGERMAEGNILYKLLLSYWKSMFSSKASVEESIGELDEMARSRYISPYHRALPYVHIDAP